MKKRLILELIVGIIMLIAILLFGLKGFAVFALLAVEPFVGKRKMDEREKQLFYRAGNYTAGALMLAAVIIYLNPDVVVNGIAIGKNWLGLLVSVLLIAHGFFGLLIMRNRK